MNPTRRRLLQGLVVLVPAATLMPRSLRAETTEEAPRTVPVVVHSDQGPHRLMVETARTQAQRSKGLMDRDHLDPDAGMLFLYPQTQSSRNGFWMYRTRIALDIAFIGEEGQIVAIETMQPCEASSPSECPVTRPGAAYGAALEVNAGYFEEQGIRVGDCVSWPGSGALCAPDAPAS
ncbi:DUF192 domain-containing protein [Halomonas korlensis]|uniref:DUF192 domain-containing protein n=1 Tax=Halomonas korlensis TaxID=463301 RepID=A0A1I7GAL8_9GAMM|nr:DUF192 domain-containing protein [Halomonas korlensis]SFU45463.1 hypothetical protein SAMN04487955_102396 [Halomonas korlensis]